MVRSAITDPEVASGAESRVARKEQPKGRKREGREKRHTVTSVLMSPTLTQLRAHGPPKDTRTLTPDQRGVKQQDVPRRAA
jgi:hypothetical protein